MMKTLQKELVVLILLSTYQCSDTWKLRNRIFRKVGITRRTTAPLSSPSTTTAPPPPTTTTTTVSPPQTTAPRTTDRGCWHNGVLHLPGSSFGEGYDAASNWCFGSYCGMDGHVIHWDKWDCHSTPPTTPPPTTIPPPGCHQGGKFYPPNSKISSGEDRTKNWCFGLFCTERGKIIAWDDFNCFGSSATTSPMTAHVTTTAPSAKSDAKRHMIRKLIQMLSYENSM